MLNYTFFYVPLHCYFEELSTSLNSNSTLANETSLVVKYKEETLELSSQSKSISAACNEMLGIV